MQNQTNHAYDTNNNNEKKNVQFFRHELFFKDSSHLKALKKLSIPTTSGSSTTSRKHDGNTHNKNIILTSTLREAKKFPMRLMKIINDTKYHDSIWWICDGSRFAISKMKFSTHVMPQEFDGTKIDSFFRILRRW